jgi:isocitrate dehydrogenase
MLDFMGWKDSSHLVRQALTRTLADKIVTYDLARQMDKVSPTATSAFGRAVVDRM